MFPEKTRLTETRENPFYGSYKESSNLEEIHWQNKKKKQQLTIVTVVVVILVLLAVSITLAITLPSILDQEKLVPPNPITYLGPSPSILGQYAEAGISTEAEQCTEIGKKVLVEMGGSAVDAAVAAALCIGVVAPQSSGLGGGLFMTIYDPETDQVYAINARETVSMQDEGESDSSYASVGVPGELAGLFAAQQKFGKAEWSDLVNLAVDLAQLGFPVSYNLARALQVNSHEIMSDPGLTSEFTNPESGDFYVEGDVMKRFKLAETLRTIAASGTGEFYNGSIAEAIEREMSKVGSPINRDDLALYSAVWQTPIKVTLGNNNLTMYGPSFPSGAPIVALGLQVLDAFGRMQPLNMSLAESVTDEHRLIETLKIASVHRAQSADPEFAPEDFQLFASEIMSPAYISNLRNKIDPYKANLDPEYYGGVFSQVEESRTAHISVIGPDGFACSLSTTINSGFGVGYMGNETGIIYNDQLSDFARENKTGIHGLPPNHYNFREQGKRPASSLSPLIFLNEKRRPVFVTGAAGGSKIIPTVISSSWRALYREMDIKTAIDHPRYTVSYNPAQVTYEYGTPDPLVVDLKRRGHAMKRLAMDDYIGNVNAICRTKRTQIILANADNRKHGTSDGF